MAEVAAKQRKHKMSRLEKKNTLIAYSFLAPNFLGFAIFTLVPVVCAILLAFVEWNGGDISNAHFVGLQNFAEIFKVDKVASKWANGDYLYFFNRVDLGIALKNTVFYALINVPLTLVCAIALALALNKAKGAVAFRTIFFFPYVASMVAICVCWNFMLMKDGPVNQMIMALGINFNKSWTADSTMAMWAIILVSVWRSMGYYMVIYLAALQGVPRELYEAATVDGANKWQTLWKVTIPNVMPSITICMFLTLTNGFKLFDQNLALTGGQPYIINPDGTTVHTTEMLALNIYNTFYGQNTNARGTAQAKAVLFFILVAAIGLIQLNATRKKEVQQ